MTNDRRRTFDVAGRYGQVPGQQLVEGVLLVGAGDEPHQLVRPGEAQVGQRHAPVALVRACQPHEPAPFLQHRVAWHERGRVAVRSEPEMDEVETGRDQEPVVVGSGLEKGVLDRHCDHGRLGPGEGGDKVGEVPALVAGRRNSLVHLVDDDALPLHRLLAELTEHRPGRVSAGHRERERTVVGDGHLGPAGDEPGPGDRDFVGVVENVELVVHG